MGIVGYLKDKEDTIETSPFIVIFGIIILIKVYR